MAIASWFDISRAASGLGAKYPELVAAQWALESGWGSHTSGKNNFFGIKGKGTRKTTKEFINGKEVTIEDEFQDFQNIEDCIKYLVDRWYKDYESNKGVNRATTREEAAKLLVAEGYATDPKYAEKLIDIMNKNSAPVTPTIRTESKISLKSAARWYSGQPHQDAAWDGLEAWKSLLQLTGPLTGLLSQSRNLSRPSRCLFRTIIRGTARLAMAKGLASRRLLLCVLNTLILS
jgi:hypothetical protein